MLLEEVRKLSPLDRLVYWIQEREAVRLKKEAGEPAPWTDDEILRTYKFTNVRRMDDRVSRWLMDNWYGPRKGHPNMIGAACLARLFNRPLTIEAVSHLAWESSPDWGLITETIKGLAATGPVFNAAYIVSTSGIRANKVEHVLDRYVRPIYEDPPEVDPTSMERSVASLSCRYGYSSFMSGQVVADLRWTVSGTWADRNTWAAPGPGSLRGINRLLGRTPSSPDAGRRWSYEFPKMMATVRAAISGVSKRLEAIDLQNCLCEWDKMERAVWGEGRPKQLYRRGT